MTQFESYGADFIAAAEKLNRLTVLSYADREEINGMNRDQLAARMQSFRYQFFKIIRDNSPQEAARLLIPHRHIWTRGMPSMKMSSIFAFPGIGQFAAMASKEPAATDSPEQTYGARYLKRMQELTGLTLTTYAGKKEWATLNQEQVALRFKRHSIELYGLIQRTEPEAAARIIFDYQNMVARQAVAANPVFIGLS